MPILSTSQDISPPSFHSIQSLPTLCTNWLGNEVLWFLCPLFLRICLSLIFKISSLHFIFSVILPLKFPMMWHVENASFPYTQFGLQEYGNQLGYWHPGCPRFIPSEQSLHHSQGNCKSILSPFLIDCEGEETYQSVATCGSSMWKRSSLTLRISKKDKVPFFFPTFQKEQKSGPLTTHLASSLLWRNPRAERSLFSCGSFIRHPSIPL